VAPFLFILKPILSFCLFESIRPSRLLFRRYLSSPADRPLSYKNLVSLSYLVQQYPSRSCQQSKIPASSPHLTSAVLSLNTNTTAAATSYSVPLLRQSPKPQPPGFYFHGPPSLLPPLLDRPFHALRLRLWPDLLSLT
jgi:hypothetical protein